MDTQHVVAPIGHYQSRDLHSINVYSFIYVYLMVRIITKRRNVNRKCKVDEPLHVRNKQQGLVK